MSFKLAEAYTELSAKTQAHDAAVDKSTAKVKSYGIESEKMKTIGSKAFLMIGLGVGAMEAALMKGAQAFRLLISSISASIRAGEGFGHGVATWIESLTGLETAIAKGKKMLAEDVRLGKVFEGVDTLAGRGKPAQIEGLSPERSAEFQKKRAELFGESVKKMDELSKLREGGGAAAGIAAGLDKLGLPGTKAAKELGMDNSQELTETEQQLEKINIHLNELDRAMAAEIENRKKALTEQEKIAAREKAVTDAAKVGLLQLGKLLGQGSGALAGLDRGAGEVGGLLARDAKRRQTVDNNELPEDMVDIAGFAAKEGKGASGSASLRSQMMGAQEFARAMLTGTAGKDPEREKQHKESIKELQAINKSIQETQGPRAAVFADGGQVA